MPPPRPTPPAKPPRSSPTSTTWTHSSSRAARSSPHLARPRHGQSGSRRLHLASQRNASAKRQGYVKLHLFQRIESQSPPIIAHQDQLQIPHSARNDNVLGNANTNDNALRGDANANTTAVASHKPPTPEMSSNVPPGKPVLRRRRRTARPRAFDFRPRRRKPPRITRDPPPPTQLAFLTPSTPQPSKASSPRSKRKSSACCRASEYFARTRVVGEIYRELDSASAPIPSSPRSCATPSAPAHSTPSTSAPSSPCSPAARARRCQALQNACSTSGPPRS